MILRQIPIQASVDNKTMHSVISSKTELVEVCKYQACDQVSLDNPSLDSLDNPISVPELLLYFYLNICIEGSWGQR